jgi:D-serine deaminase-like pyridoxal phosphate-dependent protein
VHFSKESLLLDGAALFGQLVQRSEEGWLTAAQKRYLTSNSQEHGVMEQCRDLVREVHIGENLLFLPVHSCLTANLMREYLSLDGIPIATLNL